MTLQERQSENGRRTSSALTDTEHYVPVARVIKPHGIRGEIKLKPYYGASCDFTRFPDVLLENSATGERKKFSTGKVRTQGEYFLLELVGIIDRTAAERFRTFEVLVKKEYLPELPVGRYYWHELNGLKVITQDGLELGNVSNIMPLEAHDILVITGSGREYLIPLVKEFILAKDDASRTLVVSPAPGLLEINE